MTIELRGRIIKGFGSEEKSLTVEQATQMIKEGYRGMLSFFGTYQIDGLNYHASALSVGDDTFIYEQNEKLVIPTYFQKKYLGNYNEGDQEEKVLVDVIIDPKEVEMLQLILSELY